MSSSLNESPENAELQQLPLELVDRSVLKGAERPTDAADLRCQLIQSLSDSQVTHFLTQTHSSLSQR